jgi:hypothetical protein
MLKALTVSALVAAASMAVMAAQSGPLKVASGHREILLQTTQSWNGQPYTHYPTGQPQLTTIKLTIEPRTAHRSALAHSSVPKCCLCAFRFSYVARQSQR